VKNIVFEILNGTDDSGDLSLDWEIILKFNLRSVDWIYLAQNGDWWRDDVNTVMNFAFRKRRAIFLLSERLAISEERFCPMA
jgi:hypothetical protein